MTKINRELGKGSTPYYFSALFLMRNQIYNARKLNSNAATINSANTRNDEIKEGLNKQI